MDRNNVGELIPFDVIEGRSLRGNVDRNNVGELIPFDVIEGRSLRGNVDRNNSGDSYSCQPCVVPYVGTWIEIFKNHSLIITLHVVPYVGTWIEMF